MALSNAPAATRYLYEALKAATFPAPAVQVWNGKRNVDSDPHDNVYVQPDPDSPVRITQEWHGFGAGAQRREFISIPLEIIVMREGTDPTDVEDRAWELASVVAGVLAADNSLGGNVISALPEDMTSGIDTAADAREATLTMTVVCEARARGI